MKEIGEILHVAGSGRVIIQVSEPPPEGQVLCDRGGTCVAKVMEVIGPVSSPLASATPLTNSIKKYVGKAVFAGPQEEYGSRYPRHEQQRSRGQSPKNAQKNRRRKTR